MFSQYIVIHLCNEKFLWLTESWSWKVRIFFPGHTGSLLLCRLYLVSVSASYSPLQCKGFSLWWLLLLQSTGSRAWAQESWSTGFWLWCGGSSQTRDWTHVPCISRWILNHWTTREVQKVRIYWCFSGESVLNAFCIIGTALNNLMFHQSASSLSFSGTCV